MIALVTGASSGIGEAIARRLAREPGARLVLVARREDLDLLVNNAGAAWRGRFGEAGWENVRRHMELNSDATVRLTEALLPLLRGGGGTAMTPSTGPDAQAHR